MVRAIWRHGDIDDSSRINLEALRQQLVARLAIWLTVAGGLSTWLLFPNFPFPPLAMGLTLSLLVLGIATRRLNQRFPRIACHLLTWGLTAILLVAIWQFPESSWMPFLGLLVIFLSALLIPGIEILTTLAVGGLTIQLATGGSREYQIAAISVSLVAGLALAWLSTNTIYTVLNWALTMQQRADRLVIEMQMQQAELKRTLKSLELATHSLERSNHELAIARQHADEARRMKEQFAANISHELRTPLNLILGFSEMMYRSPEVYGDMHWPPTLRRDVYHMYHNSMHLVEMIDDILDLSHFEMAQFTLSKDLTNLEPLLRGAADIASGLLRGRPVSLKVDVAPGLPQVDIDQTRIRQVVLNLLSNAQRFTTQGTIHIVAERAGDELVVTVRDTGCGISAEKLPRVFEEFYQVDSTLRRNHGGAGLGLAMCKHFVEAHQGRIWAESQVGVGSAFHFSLPVPNTQPPTSYPHVVNPLKLVASRQRVLVIDPDPSVAALISRHIERVDVVHFADDTGLEQMIAHEAAHAVIWNVPPGRLLQKDMMASRTIGIPVIKCSLPSQAWLSHDLAVTACLTKPVKTSQLLQEVQRMGPLHDILVIDDDYGFGQLVQRMLETNVESARQETPTLEVRHAYDGAQGLALMREKRPDLVLLDLAMPEMDGFQVLAQMQSEPQLAAVPVILLTVTTYAEDVLQRFGGRFVVECKDGLKPFEVLKCLDGVLGALESRFTDRVAPPRR